jgi:tetratricopeptide (TPR) repeat protein
VRATIFLALSLVLLLGGTACKPKGTVDPSISNLPDDGQTSAWQVYELLEGRIEAGSASEADREAALDKVRATLDDDTAAYAYARAAVAGRVAENRGLKALKLLEEMRTWTRRSIERDPSFADMAATRMLGTLLALAGQHLDGGDSEDGLELLESVVEAHPELALNHLRLAEALVALGDGEAGIGSLCVAMAGRASLKREEQRLLDDLVRELGGVEALGCAAEETEP